MSAVSIGMIVIINLLLPSFVTADSSKIEESPIEEYFFNPLAATFGIDIEGDYIIEEGTVKNNQFLSHLLSEFDVPYTIIHSLQSVAKEVFDVTKIRAGQDFKILRKDECSPAEFFIYTPDKYTYVVYELNEQPQACIYAKSKTKVLEVAEGHIESSLYNALTGNDLNPGLAVEMENILESSVDFHHLQKGDCFRVLFEKIYVEGEAVGYGNIHAIEFRNGSQTYQAYKFDHPDYGGYYDEHGSAMKKSFLMSPVKYSRISSYYNKSRLHPVLKTVRPHYGTDYAAPHGTEIYAVADGKVLNAAFGRGNGNYVKIRHNDVYETQYLHMSKFAKGIKPGVMVKQGQVIGYVGSTGLATGPHVCFRFWKNGKQVNHLKEKLPKTEKLKKEVINEYFTERNRLQQMLSSDNPGDFIS